MPNIFKALASIMVWVLFISSLFIAFTSLLLGILSGQLFQVGVTPPMFYPIAWTVAIGAGILSVCAMVLRKMLE